MEKIYYVYGHTDKAGNLVYIGQGKGMRAWSRNRSQNWRDHFKDDRPEVSMIALNLTQQESWDLERKIIMQYKADGIWLLNRCKGGKGGYDKQDHPLYGTKRSPETIDKMLATKTKNNSFAKYWLGKKRDRSVIDAMQAKAHTPESIEKRRQKMLGRIQSEDEKLKRRKAAAKRAVTCISTGITYESIAEATRQTGMASGKITEICQGKRKTHKGQTWRYV